MTVAKLLIHIRHYGRCTCWHGGWLSWGVLRLGGSTAFSLRLQSCWLWFFLHCGRLGDGILSFSCSVNLRYKDIIPVLVHVLDGIGIHPDILHARTWIKLESVDTAVKVFILVTLTLAQLSGRSLTRGLWLQFRSLIEGSLHKDRLIMCTPLENLFV